ncbi:hypothetical protein MTR67_007037 [Solanum verrucosum]|uniref:Uncharacterized protein n=1 Tax=Solanum verrucosum TaxID=315347 RepID=A0AAF0PZE7_SOLVR|nr:hypothetical protein MTR67_007037 [Solanum verrucosum]
MEKMITQMDLLTKNVMGGGYIAMNAASTNNRVSSNDAQFESKYNEEEKILLSQMGGFCLSYPRKDGNQGWTGRDQNWHDWGKNRRDRNNFQDRYVLLYDCPNRGK